MKILSSFTLVFFCGAQMEIFSCLFPCSGIQDGWCYATEVKKQQQKKHKHRIGPKFVQVLSSPI